MSSDPMTPLEIIDLSSDEFEDADAAIHLSSTLIKYEEFSGLVDFHPKIEPFLLWQEHHMDVNRGSAESCILDEVDLSVDASLPASAAMPICLQFWNSGDYQVRMDAKSSSQNSQNHLRIHPKFLHSNATSHKWVFGAIAELLDNAVDEVQHGATFVVVEKVIVPRNGAPALLIQDDGGGMNPESLRHCMSFGFSDKRSDSLIGQYGNGFKTSTMRLGADVIVFTRCMDKRILTLSIGLLSYTFLRETGCDDIVVPAVDYDICLTSGKVERRYYRSRKQFESNLATLLEWSPFASEDELLKQFGDIGDHGTKIIIFNLWFNDNEKLELDFDSNPKDILINGSQHVEAKKKHAKLLTQTANRIHYSLRVYISVLYLQVPKHFRIILRGQIVEPHYILSDLKYLECIKYRPQNEGNMEGEVITVIGYLKDAPAIDIHGFNIYHKNRLIRPYLKVASNSKGKGRGVVGVLEANFIQPTHDKQDFEKSPVYQKLETRLKEMTYEYWDFHCHLIGYKRIKSPLAAAGTATGLPQKAELKTGLLEKRKIADHHSATESSKSRAVMDQIANGQGTKNMHKCQKTEIGNQLQDFKIMMEENRKLRNECLEYEEAEKKLQLKIEELRCELGEVQRFRKSLLDELKTMDAVQVEALCDK